MKTNVQWMGPGTMRFIADTGSGHTLAMDGAPERAAATTSPPAPWS